jgi:hypothetical protein
VHRALKTSRSNRIPVDEEEQLPRHERLYLDGLDRERRRKQMQQRIEDDEMLQLRGDSVHHRPVASVQHPELAAYTAVSAQERLYEDARLREDRLEEMRREKERSLWEMSQSSADHASLEESVHRLYSDAQSRNRVMRLYREQLDAAECERLQSASVHNRAKVRLSTQPHAQKIADISERLYASRSATPRRREPTPPPARREVTPSRRRATTPPPGKREMPLGCPAAKRELTPPRKRESVAGFCWGRSPRPCLVPLSRRDQTATSEPSAAGERSALRRDRSAPPLQQNHEAACYAPAVAALGAPAQGGWQAVCAALNSSTDAGIGRVSTNQAEKSPRRTPHGSVAVASGRSPRSSGEAPRHRGESPRAVAANCGVQDRSFQQIASDISDACMMFNLVH